MGRIDWTLATGGEEGRLHVEHAQIARIQPKQVQATDADAENHRAYAFSDVSTGERDKLLLAIGRLVCAWGLLETSLEERTGTLRMAAGEIRAVGNRPRPGIARRFAELRTVVAMRDRRNADALTELAGIENEVQRIDSIRTMVTEGFQGADDGGLLCRDGKNRQIHFALDMLDREAEMLDTLRIRLTTI